MTRAEWRRNATRYAGLVAGPVAWALNTQLGQILPYLECDIRLPLLAAISALLAVFSLAAALVSWLGNGAPAEQATSYRIHTEDFITGLSAFAGAMFAFALVLQGASSLVLSGCQR
jgi:hypothetical protein